MDMYCSYIYIYIYKADHRNLEIRKTRNDFSVQVRNFLLPLSLKVLRHKEREAQYFYPGFFICTPSVRHQPKASASQRKSTVFPEAGFISTNWLFQNLPKSSAHFRCVTSFALASLRFPSRAIVTSLSDTSALLALAWTPVLMLHLTNPCTEPKDSQPN